MALVLLAQAASNPTAPVVSVSTVSTSAIQVSLTTPSTEPTWGIGGYDIAYSSLGPSGPFTTITILANQFPYQISSLNPGTTYYVVCRGYDNSANNQRSPPSPVVSTTTNSVSPSTYWMNLQFGTGDPTNPLQFSNRAFSGTNGWADLIGYDNISGQFQPPDAAKGAIWGGTPPNQTSIQCIGVTPLTDQTRALITGTKHDGTTGTIYRNTLNVPYVEKPVGGMQNDFITWPDTVNGTQGMVYIRKWLYLQSDFFLRMRNSNTTNNGVTTSTTAFFIIDECKTAITTARIQLSIGRSNVSGFADTTQSYFQIDYDSFPSGVYSNFRVFAIGPNPTVTPTTGNNSGFRVGPAVPVGQWFKVETAYRMSPNPDGWCWFAMNGTEVFLAQGANMAPASAGEKINRLFMLMHYTNLDRTSSTFSYDCDLLQVATAFPSDATSRSQPLS